MSTRHGRRQAHRCVQESTPPYIQFTTEKTESISLNISVSAEDKKDVWTFNMCVGIEWVTYFNLEAEDSEIKAAGAGVSAMETQVAIKNHLEIGSLSIRRIPLVLFNLTHVNEALQQFNLLPVHGVIGADLAVRSGCRPTGRRQWREQSW